MPEIVSEIRLSKAEKRAVGKKLRYSNQILNSRLNKAVHLIWVLKKELRETRVDCRDENGELRNTILLLGGKIKSSEKEGELLAKKGEELAKTANDLRSKKTYYPQVIGASIFIGFLIGYLIT